MSDWQFEELLGPVLFSCRRRSLGDWWAATGASRLVFYFFIPAGILLLALYAAFAVGLCLGVPAPQLEHPACATAFVVACLVLGWLIYVFPRRDYLIVHEDGFRFRLALKKLAVRFDELAELRVGLTPRPSESRLRRHALAGWQRRWVQNFDKTALQITLRNGKRSVYRGFFARYDPDDATEFIGTLTEKCPDCVVTDPSLEPEWKSPTARSASAGGRRPRLQLAAWAHIALLVLVGIGGAFMRNAHRPGVRFQAARPMQAAPHMSRETYDRIQVGMNFQQVRAVVRNDQAFHPWPRPDRNVQCWWLLDDGHSAIARFRGEQLILKQLEHQHP